MRRSVRSVLLCSILTSPGCAGFKQAYHERVCWDGSTPIECPSHSITLSCNQPLSIEPPTSPIPEVRLQVRLGNEVARPRVGALFSQHGDKPIFLQGTSAWQVLRDDLERLLVAGGFPVVDDPAAADMVIEGDVTLLDVRSEPGGLFDLKAPTTARATITVELSQPDGSDDWEQVFSGMARTEVAYAFLSDSERLLGEAYCGALSSFAKTASSPEFLSRLAAD